MTGSQDGLGTIKGPPWPRMDPEKFAALKAKVEAFRAEQRRAEQERERQDDDADAGPQS